MQSRVEEVLASLLDAGHRPDFATVRGLAVPEKPTIPVVHIPSPDLTAYDGLILAAAGGEA